MVPGHGAAVWAGTPRPPSPWTLPPALQGGFQVILPGVFSQWDTSPQKRAEGIHYRCPSLLSWPRLLQLPSEFLQGGRAPHRISKGAPRHPAEVTPFGCLYPASCSFGHDPKFQTTVVGRDIAFPVNLQLKYKLETHELMEASRQRSSSRNP